MQNKLTITEPELIDMFANIEGHYSDLVTWEGIKLEQLLRNAQYGDVVNKNGVVHLPIILRLQTHDAVVRAQEEMIEIGAGKYAKL